uniref:Uncharacterized protein n=1 Tax=Psilocybe cubensis TaxID=181762 RepID=A0A8H7XSA8_PSICU
MSPVHALDRYYLILTLLVTIGYQLSGFAIAWSLQFDKITDFTGGFLLFRVLKMGSDSRFDDIRSHFWKFLGFWIGQILWIWTVSLPLTILNSPGVSELQRGGSNPKFGTSRDIAGIVLWALGFLIESIADAQKFYYKSRKVIPKGQPTNDCGHGLAIHPTSASKHTTLMSLLLIPEVETHESARIICWWGIWILCLSPTTNGNLPSSSRAAQYGAIMSPIFTTLLLMFGSGIPTAEKPTAKKFYLLSHGPSESTTSSTASDSHIWANYKAYLRQTSILIPLPPFLYRPLPSFIKQTVLLDFPIYRFDESSDGVAAVEEARRVEQ